MNNPAQHRPTWAEIDLGNLVFNYRSIRAFLGRKVKLMAVVKADAYGHGAAECARALSAAGADWFAVALVEEALELRAAGIETPIICLGGVVEGAEDVMIEYDITPAVFDLDGPRRFNDAAKRAGRKAAIHLKIDTGMGRVGLLPGELGQFIELLGGFEKLKLEGAMTHFASADDLEEKSFTEKQIEVFYQCLDELRSSGFDPELVYMANSPGAVVYPASRANMARIGGLLYGLGGDIIPPGIEGPELRPVLSLYSQIADLKTVPPGYSLGYGRTFTTKRESTIALVPIGYFDGFRRALSNIGNALVKGKRVPVVGRVSMDWTLLDVTDVEGARPGDRVTFIGSDGNESIAAEEIAAQLGTISYEVTCGIGRRVPKKAVNEP